MSTPRLSADQAADDILLHGLAANAAVYDELKRALRASWRKLGKNPSINDLLEATRLVLLEFIDPFAEVLQDATLAGWLIGAGEIAGELATIAPHGALPPLSPGAPSPGPEPTPTLAVSLTPTIPPIPPEEPPGTGTGEEPPEEPDDGSRINWDGGRVWLPLIDSAVESLQSRRLVTRDEFDRLSAEARSKAFTVAGQATQEALEAVRTATAEAVDTGSGFRKFKKALDESLDVSPIGVHRQENIFRTNIAGAYSQGLDDVLAKPIVNEMFPYEEVLPIRDARLTELCRIVAESGIQGTGIFLRADPIYQKFKSPRHYCDRCGRRPMTIAEAARRGILSAQRWLETGQGPSAEDFVPHPPVDLPKGWTPGGMAGI